MEPNEFQKEFDEWWQNEECFDIRFRPLHQCHEWNYTNVCNHEAKCNGSYSTVYTQYWQDPNTRLALKTAQFHDKEGLTCLYREYKIHKMMYDLYPQYVVKPVWFKKITVNNGVVSPMAVMALEYFEGTLYDYLAANKGDTDVSREWKKEIISVIKEMYDKHGFAHRDTHINNIAIFNNTSWKFFDFGLAYSDNMVDSFYSGFFKAGMKPSATFTERTLRFSWCTHGDDDEWVPYELKKIGKCDSKYWGEGMDVVIKNHPLADRGDLLYKTSNGTWLVRAHVPSSQRTLKHITMPPTTIKRSARFVECEFMEGELLPDVTSNFIHYYLSSLP